MNHTPESVSQITTVFTVHEATKITETIRCAAIRSKSGIVLAAPRPARHHTLFALAHDLGTTIFRHSLGDNQGFMTSKGRYLNRAHSEIVARGCGQLIGPTIGSVLTSEDLW